MHDPCVKYHIWDAWPLHVPCIIPTHGCASLKRSNGSRLNHKAKAQPDAMLLREARVLATLTPLRKSTVLPM
eukprot:scaffold25875_cov34-Tisochrysis_lutea.AAC.1